VKAGLAVGGEGLRCKGLLLSCRLRRKREQENSGFIKFGGQDRLGRALCRRKEGITEEGGGYRVA